MKLLANVIVAAVLVVASYIPVKANDDACRPIFTSAYLVMQLRQSGTSIEEQMALLRSPELDANIRTIGREMVLEAYETPPATSDSLKRQQSQEFANRWTALCYRVRQ